MRKHAIAIGKVLGFLIVTLALGWVLTQGVVRVVPSLLAVEAALAAAAIATSWCATKLEGRSLASIGFAAPAPARHFAAGTGLGLLVVGGSTIVFICFGWYQASVGLSEPLVSWALRAIGLCALVALFEETLFRGYAFQTAAQSFGPTSAIIITGALFGALHLLNPTLGLPPWLKVVGCGCVACYGMLAAIARLSTRGLWLPMGLHFAWNLLEAFVFGFPDSGLPSPHALLHPVITGPVILTGGGYGPEGGLIMLLFACLSIALIVVPKRGVARRKRTELRPESQGAVDGGGFPS